MRNALSKLCIILATILLLFSVGFFTVSLILKDNEYIEDKYRSLGVSEQMGMSVPDLVAATDALLDYMRGERANIRIGAKVNGEALDDVFYHEKEVVHMAEVQVLWFTLSAAARYGVLAAAGLIVLGILLMPRGSRRQLFFGGVVWGSGIFGGALLLLGLWAVVNFQSFWTVFHFILFPASLVQYIAAGSTPEALNSLNWVLSSDSIMVNMLMPIFPSLVLRCAVFIVAEIAFVLLLGVLFRFVGRKKLDDAVAEVVTIEHDANEPIPIDGPDLVLAHQLRNAPVALREELKRRAEAGEPLTEFDPPKPQSEAPAAEEPQITLADRTEAEKAPAAEEPQIALADRAEAEKAPAAEEPQIMLADRETEEAPQTEDGGAAETDRSEQHS